jgi:hypothetical protein
MTSCNSLVRVCLLGVALAFLGCSHHECVEPIDSEPTLIEGLRDFCFCGSNDCDDYAVDILLHLDTVNLPSNNMGQPWLILSSLPTTPIADGNDRLGLEFVGTLDPEIDPGILNQVGWKIRIRHARIKYCENCYSNDGLVPTIYLTGSLDGVEFLHDQSDEREIYLNVRHAP